MRPFFLSCMLALSALPACAEPLDEGVAALKSGDYAKAYSILKPLADRGNADAQTEVGIMNLGLGLPRNYPEAVKWFSLAAAQGNAMAEGDLGESYRSGRGVARDYAKALHWLSLAAHAGQGAAQFGLGMMHALGQGAPVNPRLAYIWLSLAAGTDGLPLAIANRDIARRQLSPAQLKTADEMVAACKASHLERCG